MRKPCKTCLRPFSEDAFYRAGQYWMSECKECWKERVKLRRLTNPAVQAYDRARYQEQPHRKADAANRARERRSRNPLAYKAHSAVGNALRDGRLQKKPCEVCGADQNLHAHHKDYAKPLDVVWLCARCHHRLHALFPELEGAHKRAG